MSALPEGWCETTLGELGRWSSGGTPNSKNLAYYGGDIPWVRTGDLRDNEIGDVEGRITQEGLSNSSAKIFPKGTLLVAMYGATIGRTGLLQAPAATNQACAALLPDDGTVDLVPFLWWYFRYAVDDFRALGQGGAQPNISQTVIKSRQFWLPPLPEQRRIVAKLDRLSARTKAARAHLARVQSLATRAKQATLAAAFRGDATEIWRNKNGVTRLDADETASAIDAERTEILKNAGPQRKGKSAKADHHRNPVDLNTPEVWRTATLEAISSPVRLIQYGILKPGQDVPDGVPYVKVLNITGGEVQLEKIRHTTPEIHDSYRRSTLRLGDILLTIRGTVGRLAFVPPELDGGNITQDTVRIEVLRSVNSRFVFWWLHSPLAEQYFRDNQKGVAVRGINVGDVRPMEVPLPGRAEQEEIVRRIEAAFARIDRMVEDATRAAHLLDRLDQRLLAKAFRGELVPQDPNDEPAADLLARIKATRAAASKPKRRKRTASA